MANTVKSRLQRVWNVFSNRDPTICYWDYGPSTSSRSDKIPMKKGSERSIINAIYNRIAVDAAKISIQHVKLDESGRYESMIDSDLNECLTLSANVDQTGREFIEDAVMSMLDEGVVAIVPVEARMNPGNGSLISIKKLRTGKVLQWYPKHVRLQVYNEDSGYKEEIVLPKSMVAIIENPFYSVMNAPNSTMQRLIKKLNILDAIDEQSGSGKLDLIIQLPYSIKHENQRILANKRQKDIEAQLNGAKFGVAYIDSTEKITQLNRPIENNLMSQIEYLTSMLYSQLGISVEILNGTADDKAMLNYENRMIEPIISSIVDEMKRKFLSKTARSQKQSILFFHDPFGLVPVNDIAEIADKMTRNEIMTSNEIRQKIGMPPAKDPKADELRNSNISQSKEEIQARLDQPIQQEEENIQDEI